MAQALVNMNTLVRLADADVEQKVTDFGALPLDIRESLTRQMAERRQEVVDAAAEEIVNLLGNKDTFLGMQASAIARFEEQIKALKDLMGKVQQATNYGLSTQNFLPLAKAMGMGVPTGTKDALTKIPAGWTAPTAEAAAPAAAA